MVKHCSSRQEPDACNEKGGPIEAVFPGDVVWFAPGEKHWHGATPTTAMTHIAIQEKQDGRFVDWMDAVTDEQYNSQIDQES